MSNFNFRKFLKDYNILPSDILKNTSPGWINITCPFCDDSSNHLGFNIKKNRFNCWKCGGHSIVDVIMTLAHVNYLRAKQIEKQYTHNFRSSSTFNQEREKIKRKKHLNLPIGVKSLSHSTTKLHREYLRKRNFDSIKLEKEFNLMGTGLIGDYKFRIIAPIRYRGKLVSYQGRDITDKQKLRYKACSKEDEVIHHKEILYNLDNAKKDKVIVVEGITDVWRIGNDCVATFGTSFTCSQVLLLGTKFDSVFILFDKEEEAQNKAENLAIALDGLAVKTEICSLDIEDPAKLTDREVILLKKDLLGV